MIKLFSKIRKQLLDENKTGRYLKYAIGEIVLVMIGILLALQVNTWNNSRELKKEELKMMKSLHKEFSKNFIKFDESFEGHVAKKESIETIMSIKAELFSMDSLNSLLVRVNYVPTFDPSQGIYNSIINSGKIELISNDVLKEKISAFQDLLMDYQEDEDATKDFATQNLHKFILSEMTYDNFQVKRNNAKVSEAEEQRIKEKYIKLIDSDMYESQLIFLRAWMEPVFREGPILREEMVSIISLLKSETEKHEN